jgi:hypothetical protein
MTEAEGEAERLEEDYARLMRFVAGDVSVYEPAPMASFGDGSPSDYWPMILASQNMSGASSSWTRFMRYGVETTASA